MWDLKRICEIWVFTTTFIKEKEIYTEHVSKWAALQHNWKERNILMSVCESLFMHVSLYPSWDFTNKAAYESSCEVQWESEIMLQTYAHIMHYVIPKFGAHESAQNNSSSINRRTKRKTGTLEKRSESRSTDVEVK